MLINERRTTITLCHGRDYQEAARIDSFFTRHVASGVASGIDHLHGCGIVHLDIKASNVMLDGAGVPKLVGKK